MTSQYKGMRWLKCDLHMHTPGDSRHWSGDRTVEGREPEAAKAFAEACYHTGLDVIAVTDHNFLSKGFLPHLQTAFKDIERDFNHKITLFPGFEFKAAGVGRGAHVLCLFEPESNLEQVQSVLFDCGVAYPGVNSNGDPLSSDKNLKEILQIVQIKHGGIVILPHAMSNDGIFDNSSISEWLQQDQFINPELLAVEVQKPVLQMNPAFQKLFCNGEECHLDWKRIRPIATLMSSDNKNLIVLDDNNRPTPNSIGYRYSWIKMSAPSIESLRQAFLDHESRIILPLDILTDIHPANRDRQDKIKSISIRNVRFLSDQVVQFSPNMNCVIGGRGSGKSTILEYLRIALRKDKNQDLDEGTKERINRILETMNEAGTEIEVCWESTDGVNDCILWQNGKTEVCNRTLPDPETFFNSMPIGFYSQQQLSRLTESKSDDGGKRQAQRLLALVDGFAKGSLDEMANQERKLKIIIDDVFANFRKIRGLEKENKRLRQEQQELDRQWRARSEIQEAALRHQQLKAEARYLDRLFGAPGKQFSDVTALAQEIAGAHSPFQLDDSPHTAWFRAFDENVQAFKYILARTIQEAVDQFNSKIDNIKASSSEWSVIEEELAEADEKFREACAAKGLNTDDVGHLQEIEQSRAKKRREIDENELEIKRLKTAAGDPEVAMQGLHQIWREQFKTRIEAAERANELAVLKEGSRRFIEVTVKYQQDYKDFQEIWQRFAPADGRTRLGRNWEDCGQKLYGLFVQQQDANSPWQVLQNQLSLAIEGHETNFAGFTLDLVNHISENIDQWEKIRCSRVKDTVDMKLFRPDCSTAGSIAEGSLSDGQRNTAALALLLAQEGGPIVIDQPEDELDSNFVFRELIPMIRNIKSKRQLIMATHNANLPVNGDAELVYALETCGGKGVVRAEGALDQEGVTKAVLDIMEGTEEAFRRRREKYHF